MSEHKKPGFYVGQTEDGRFLAASVRAPAFCFFDDSEDMVIAKAQRAFAFFHSGEGTRHERPKSQEKRVLSFVPHRRVEACLEAA